VGANKKKWRKAEEIRQLGRRSVDHKCTRKISDRVSEISKCSYSINECLKLKKTDDKQGKFVKVRELFARYGVDNSCLPGTV
jgi:hypothetical protein